MQQKMIHSTIVGIGLVLASCFGAFILVKDFKHGKVILGGLFCLTIVALNIVSMLNLPGKLHPTESLADL
jgi:hypothetical protein